MAQGMKRSDFLKLTVTVVTVATSGVVGCGDDDDDTIGSAGTSAGGKGVDGGSAPDGGKGGSAGSNNGGAAGGGIGSGGKDGASGTAGAQAGGGAGGATPIHEYGGEGGTAGESDGGSTGESGSADGGAAGAGGSGLAPDNLCQGPSITEPASSHNHLPASLQSFAVLVNGSNPTNPFRLLTTLGHWHDIVLTLDEVSALRAGGTLLMKESTAATQIGQAPSGHTHIYKITCS